MSDLSKIKDEVESFFSQFFTQLPPEAQPAAQAAASNVHSAISEAESAAASSAGALLTVEAPTLESAVASTVPAELKPIASLVVQLGLAEVTSRIQSATTSAA